jgi:multidrug efflux pump subunit AcrA (membrane-fusion protein)
MNLINFFENIPPAFYGVIIGSFLTIIGVVLTNISNTKRLRLQHEHEQKLRNKERDLNMRREVYMDAMEALSAGITAISRFSELNETPEALMKSYSNLSSKLGKVTIVGKNETIEALANFQLEVNGAFLRMSAKRDKFDAILRQSQAIEAEVASLQAQIEQLTTQLSQANVNQEHMLTKRIQSEIDLNQSKLTETKIKEGEIGVQLWQTVGNLVKTSMAEVSALNKLLVPLISLMRNELELPFNKEHFAQILEKGNDSLEAYMSTFFDEYEEIQGDN